MMHFGLIGKNLKHSFSKEYFSKKFAGLNLDADYSLFELPTISEFSEFIAARQLSGLNVTIPYKQSIIPYLNSLSEEAKDIGAVNVISFQTVEGCLQIRGWNTDAPALEKELHYFAPEYKGKVLLLGTGGAAAAADYVLSKNDISYTSVSRNPHSAGQLSYTDLNEEIITTHRLIINATPVGMYPLLDAIPDLPWKWIGENHMLFDMVYNPEVTRFLQKGTEQGAKVRNGLGMLHTQAELAWEIWQKDLPVY